ncbi:MAG: dicarboxylate/amino acid:cation symporter [Deltaproteobacteria bacterium TMED126]|nr:dicarboxylate/amino acid:cation symporter [Candidatus Dadabacteria bacterium]NSW98032.1 dicarboxylate/amino acid:cation symporter [Deltaproteobacteria bacterium TMED126]
MEKKISLAMLFCFLASIPIALFFPDFMLKSKPLGDYFLIILKSFVPFLIFSTISFSIASFSSGSNLQKMVPLTLILYLISTIIAISISLFVSSNVNFGINPGIAEGLVISKVVELDVSSIFSPLSPNDGNFIELLFNGNPLVIMLFAVLFGLIVRFFSNSSNNPVQKFLLKFNYISLKIITYFMLFAPIAIYAIFGNLIINSDINIILSLIKFVVVSIIIFVAYFLIVHGSILKLLLNESILSFFNKIKSTLFFAFISSSSAATIPFTIKTAEDNLKINKEITNFVIPIGATVNMDGSAIYLGIAAVFVSQLIGLDLSVFQYALILITATIGSIGAAGVPSVGLVMMTIVFTAIGIPIEAIAILAGVDRILDMFRTSLNVAGDLLISKIVCKYC